jgi:hypothetical protein
MMVDKKTKEIDITSGKSGFLKLGQLNPTYRLYTAHCLLQLN